MQCKVNLETFVCGLLSETGSASNRKEASLLFFGKKIDEENVHPGNFTNFDN
jgi:hypothetical protein